MPVFERAFIWWFLCFALRFESCGATTSCSSAARVNQSFSVVAVLPSQVYSFLPAIISVIGHDFPSTCFVQLTLSSDTFVQSCSSAHSPSSFQFPCRTSTHYIVTFSLPAHSAQLLQQHCETKFAADSSCSVDVSIFSDSPFASHSTARMARALVILPSPVFHTLPLLKPSLSTCPIIVTGFPPPPLCDRACARLKPPIFATGAHFISSPLHALTCQSQRCKLQCGIHNDSSILLIAEAACEGTDAFPVHLSYSTGAATAVQASLDLFIVSSENAAAPGCAGDGGLRLSTFVTIRAAHVENDDAATRYCVMSMYFAVHSFTACAGISRCIAQTVVTRPYGTRGICNL